MKTLFIMVVIALTRYEGPPVTEYRYYPSAEACIEEWVAIQKEAANNSLVRDIAGGCFEVKLNPNAKKGA